MYDSAALWANFSTCAAIGSIAAFLAGMPIVVCVLFTIGALLTKGIFEAFD